MTEATPEDVAEQTASPSRDAARTPEPSLPLEAAPGDVAEQALPAAPGEHGSSSTATRDLPLEADAADAAEQAVVVDLDEDDRR